MALITVPTTSDGHDSDKCRTSDDMSFITTNPDDKNSTEGVSLKNVLEAMDSPENEQENAIHLTIEDVLTDDFEQPEGYNWYFLRISYNRAEKFYTLLKDKMEGFLLWMPYQKRVWYENNRKFETLDPIFKSNIFIYSTFDKAMSLTCRDKENGYPYVNFAYDHTSRNEFGRDHVITIPFAEMRNFIRAEQIHHPWAHVVTEEQVHFRPGGLVRVTSGPFEGIIGRVARVFGQTRVVITIKGVLRYASAFISQKMIEPCEEPAADPAGHSHEKRVKQARKRIASKFRKEKRKVKQ